VKYGAVFTPVVNVIKLSSSPTNNTERYALVKLSGLIFAGKARDQFYKTFFAVIYEFC
jgi:hypothetical protein